MEPSGSGTGARCLCGAVKSSTMGTPWSMPGALPGWIMGRDRSRPTAGSIGSPKTYAPARCKKSSRVSSACGPRRRSCASNCRASSPITASTPGACLLATGGAQWGSQFIPNIQSYYLSKSKNYHIWFPPVANVSIFINLTNPVLSQLPVREAMAYAIDRPKVSELGEYGYEPAANQTDIVKPTFTSWYDSSASKKYDGYTYDPSKAMSILKNAGYKEKNGVFQTPKGPLSFTIDNIGGYSDWVASVSVIETELKAVGISITPDNLAANVFFEI